MCGFGKEAPTAAEREGSAEKPRGLTPLSSSPSPSPPVLTQPRPLAHPSPFPFPLHSAGSPYKWLNKDPLALAIGFLGWTVPAASPAPSFGGGSLFGKLTESIGAELAHFPTGPAVDSPFWLYFTIYHVGLFVCLTLAQIGVQARKQGYFE